MKNIKKIFALFLALLLMCGYVMSAVPELNVMAAETSPISIDLSYKVLNQKATISVAVASENTIVSVKYLKGTYKNRSHANWTKKAKDITGKDSFTVSKAGTYSVLAEDSKGNKLIARIKVTLEFRAVWIAYYDFEATMGKSEEVFTTKIGEMFDNAVSLGMNAVVAHVRPFSDAMYKSKYYPWSRYASGTQGVSPGYDPLEIMVREAHARELEFHAWLNPYRITSSGTDVSVLADTHPAKKWLTDDDPSNDRNVLALGNKLYYNPSVKAVRKLITNGIKEIVKNYDVDGIHFDDYFYPDMGSKYASVFDAEEYEAYASARRDLGKSVKTIVEWRRYNVNLLVKYIYSEIKKIDDTVIFGISPGGFIDYLSENHRYYVDFETWLSKPGYIDYICPQLYWSFAQSNKYPFDSTLERWLSYRTADVKMYVGVGAYKVTAARRNDPAVDAQWKETDLLARMVEFARNTKKVDGFVFFDYRDMVDTKNSAAINELLDVLN